MVKLIGPWLEDPDKLEVPRRSQALASWCLPMLSKSLEADEKERDALALYNTVKNMAARQQEDKANG